MWFACTHCWATEVFSVRSNLILYNEKPTVIGSWVEGSAVACQPEGNGSVIISIAKIRYQEISCEDTAEEWPLWRAVTK
jgi:hypothetical protein